MRPYLSNYIQTLSNRRQEKVASLLEEARVGKEQLSVLAKRLEESASSPYSPLVLAKDRPNTRILSSVITRNLTSLRARMIDMYDSSNVISLLLNSHATVLASEIKELEDQLIAMEKMAFNFAFLLSDNQAFDFAHLEPFSDDRERDVELGTIPDRSGLSFGPAEQASVRTDEGVLTLPETLIGGHGLAGEIVKGNALSFVVSDTGLDNVFNPETSIGWRMMVAAAGPITASLPEAPEKKGAQVVLEFRLSQAAPCSEVKLVPYADMPMELVQVVLYSSEEDGAGVTLLADSKKLDRPYTLHFPMQSVHRFRVVLNQNTYHRNPSAEKPIEHRYREAIRSITRLKNISQKRTERYFNIYRLERGVQQRIIDKHGAISLPSTDLHADRGPMSLARLLHTIRMNRGEGWKSSMGDRSFFLLETLRERFPELVALSRKGGEFETASLGRILNSDNPILQIFETESPKPNTHGFNYYYNLGLQHVAIGVESPGFKGVFVSKPIPSPGDVGSIRIKVAEDNYTLSVSERHSKVLTSTEYSISNMASPSREIDWLPILPVGTDQVIGERLFITDNGVGLFRFPAQVAQGITVYRNGYQFPVETFLSGSPGSFIGLKIEPGTTSAEDILTVDYFPAGDDPTVVNLESFGFDQVPPLVSAHDTTGSGERFLATGDRNTVALSFVPYVDPKEAAAGGYQPITVRLETGEVAENLTDYQTNKSVALPASGYYYIHSRDTLMFNQPITTPFRVYYQYLQNNLRVRTILRCNVQDFVSPKVDYVHLKAKTRRPDVRQL